MRTTPEFFPSQSAKDGRARASRRRSLFRLAALAGLILALLVGPALAAVHTGWVARALWRQVSRLVPGQLSGELVEGSLSDGVTLRNVVYRNGSMLVKFDRLQARWDVSLRPPTLSVRRLRIGDAEVTLPPGSDQRAAPPQQIKLPLAIDLEHASIDRLVLHRNGEPTTLRDIALRASSDGVHHVLHLDNAATPYGTASAFLRLDGAPPHALSGNARLSGSYGDQPYRADARVAGTLQAPSVELDAGSGNASAHARIDATPYADVPLKSARIDVRRLDPSALRAGWPKAALELHAFLSPAGKAGTSGGLTVAGPVSLVNANPGPIDRSLLPVASARAEVSISQTRQTLTGLAIALAGEGRLEGKGELRNGSAGEFTLRASELDANTLHTAMRPTQLSGPLNVRLAGDTQFVTLDLAGPAVSVSADAELTPQQIRVRDGRLAAGSAQLKASATLARDVTSAYSVSGTLTDFNPAAFLASMPQAKSGAGGQVPQLPFASVAARIDMDFDAQGALRPAPSAKVWFNVHDGSTYAGLPMSGGGHLHVQGKRVLSSDAQLSVAGNDASVKGSFGEPSDRLRFAIDAPGLERLGLGLSGLLHAEGELQGTPARPLLDARYQARNLAYGSQRLDSLAGAAHLRGLPQSDPNARIDLRLDAHGLQNGAARVHTLSARIDGSYASHDIRIEADGRLRGEHLDLAMTAQGGLRERSQGMAWNGTLRTLENRGVPRVSMASPLPLSVAPGKLELGATRLSVGPALIALRSFLYEADRIRSAGDFSGLDVGTLLAMRRQITGSAMPVNGDLVLDGRWDVTLADRANGFIDIERRRGDIRIAGAAGSSSLGVQELSLRAELDNSAVALRAQARAARVGDVTAQARFELQRSDGRLALAMDAPVSGRITGTIPRLETVAALTGPRIDIDGRATIDLAIGGQLGDPKVSGTLTGDGLGLALYDQGVQLSRGSARIRVEDNIASLEQVEFHSGAGTLHAIGRIPMEHPAHGTHVDLIADNLQLLSNPSGRLTLSGQAAANGEEGQLLVSGKFTVDQALFNLPKKAAPKLDDDVVVIRGGEPTASPSRAPAAEPKSPLFAPRVNILVDLGDNFRFEGAGADIRLAGTVTITSAPAEKPQAFGTVRVVEGTYEAFGAKLAIERGVLSFHGPLRNPDVNILAMRRGQEVAAGVQVTGTVNQPHVQLVSEPNVSEEDKLSWLMFGHAAGGTELGQTQAAKGAALGLLNSLGGARIAKTIGLDELAIGQSDFGDKNQQVVNLGKEITDRLFIGYEQGLAGAESALKLTYELSRYWKVVLRGGAVTGLDLLFNKRFDTIGGG